MRFLRGSRGPELVSQLEQFRKIINHSCWRWRSDAVYFGRVTQLMIAKLDAVPAGSALAFQPITAVTGAELD